MKIYILLTITTTDGDQFHNVEIFKSQTAARKQLKKEQNAAAEFFAPYGDEAITDADETNFFIYEAGNANNNSASGEIIEKEI